MGLKLEGKGNGYSFEGENKKKQAEYRIANSTINRNGIHCDFSSYKRVLKKKLFSP